MQEVMVKERQGFHNLFVQIPEVVWDALCEEADATGEAITKLVTEMLRKRYNISREDMPKPRRAGRPPKKRP